MRKILEKTGWVAILLLALITVAPGVFRLADVTAGGAGNADIDDRRYYAHPISTWLHILPGMVFMLLGLVQFSRRIRAKWIGLHRLSGRIFIVTGAAAALFSFVIVVQFPVIGGWTTGVATYTFGLLMLYALIKAYRHIRRREIALHREWMIRAFAIGLGVSTIRVAIGVLLISTDKSFRDVFGMSFWIGFTLNLIIAELWIRGTRPDGRSPAGRIGLKPQEASPHP